MLEAETVPKRVTMPDGALALDTFDFYDMLQEQHEPLQWIIPQYLPEGLTLLFARPKVGKSMTCLALALRVARKTSGGVDGHILYLMLDDVSKRRLQDRTRSLLQGSELEAGRIWGCTKAQPLDDGLIPQLEAWMIDHPETRLIVVDVYARVKPKADDDVYKSDYNALTKLQEFAVKWHLAIILVHHTRKASTPPGGDWIDSVNGSTGLTGAVDTLWMIERKPHSNDLVLHIKGRDTMGELEVEFSLDDIDAPWKLRGEESDDPNGSMTDTQAAIHSNLTATPQTPRDIATLTGLKPETVRGLLRRMLHKGLVEQSTYGAYCLPRVTELQEKNIYDDVTLGKHDDNTNQGIEQGEGLKTNSYARVTSDAVVTLASRPVTLALPIAIVCPYCGCSIFNKDLHTVTSPLASVTMANCPRCHASFNADGQRQKQIRMLEK